MRQAHKALPDRSPLPGAWAQISDNVAQISLWLILGWVCLSLSWLTTGRYLPWPSFRQEMMAAMAAVLFAAAAVTTCERIVWPRIGIVAALTAGIPVAQWAIGQIAFLDDAVICALYLASFGACVCVGASLAQSTLRDQAIHGLALCLAGVAVLSAGMALNQWLGPSVLEGWVDSIAPRDRPYANMGQPNHLATQLLLGVAAVIYLYNAAKVNGWCASLAIAWMGWGVVLTQSRTAWLAIAMMTLWWWTMRRRVSMRIQPSLVVVGLAAFVVSVALHATLTDLWSGAPAPDGTPSELRLAAGTRPAHWYTLTVALMKSPWFGFGWNQVSTAQFAVATSFPAIGEPAWHSHSLILDLLLYNGIPVGTMLGAALVVWLARATQRCRTGDTWFMLLCICIVLVHALLEFPLHYAYYLLPVGLMVGLTHASSPLRDSPRSGVPRTMLVLAAVFLAGTAGAVGMEYLKAEESLRDVELSTRRIGAPPQDLPAPDWRLLESWAAYHRASTMRVGTGMSLEDMDSLRRAVIRYPYPNVIERYAQALTLNGDSRLARNILLHGCKIHTVGFCDGMRRRWQTFLESNPNLPTNGFPMRGETERSMMPMRNN